METATVSNETEYVPGAWRHEILRRRTFAIISHPDAGKTTLTEKLLFFAGAIDRAGSVRPKKQRKTATSDWMAMEQARGISITSTVLQFEYEGRLLNLLDTPGHQDFSEDTYRTLTAVDCAVMVLDAAKGIEPQTLKLFEVCRLRRLPILTFVNKMDQPSLEPVELFDSIERVLRISACPVNWPVGLGADFRGVAELDSRRFIPYHRMGGYSSGEELALDSEEFVRDAGTGNARQLSEELELLGGVVASFDRERFLKGEQTPIFFGSALHDFGVEAFLNALVEHAPPPQARAGKQGPVDPLEAGFSAFVFKIQGNMDPNHRDNMAFLRICSGRFERDMQVYSARLGKKIRMTRMHRLFARERETLEEAFAGDVVGVVNPGMFTIGDTLSAEPGVEYGRIPSFPPEHFAVLRCLDMSRNKQFRKGIAQLAEEGVAQLYHDPEAARWEPILGAVGKLQFDVMQSRLLQEYGVTTTVDFLPYECACWPQGSAEALARVRWPSFGFGLVRDHQDRLVCLFRSRWDRDHFTPDYPDIVWSDMG